jgi:thiosulfate dehydrogenase [quinone] large subunit
MSSQLFETTADAANGGRGQAETGRRPGTQPPGTHVYIPDAAAARAFLPHATPTHVTVVSSLIPDGTTSVATRATTRTRRRRQPGRRRLTRRTAMLPARLTWALTRVSLGFVFIWAFLGDITGFARPAPATRSFLDGGGPIRDHLLSAHGTFAALCHALAGPAYTQTIFRAALAIIGGALILGVGMRVAATAGTAILVLMWLSAMPIATGPLLDQHLIYALVIIGLALANAGDTIGLGAWWSRRWVVRRIPALR